MIEQHPVERAGGRTPSLADTRAPATRFGPRIGEHAVSLGLALGVLVAWEALARLLGTPKWLLPAPTDVLAALVGNGEAIAGHGLVTLAEVLVGFALAFVFGVGLAVAIAKLPIVERALYPFVIASQTIPIIAIAPLLLIWLGYGLWPKAIVVVLICFFPIVVNTVDGFRAVDPELRNLLRTMGATPRQVFEKVEVPTTLPYLLSGTKVAVAVSVIGAVVGEWVGAQAGLGYYMVRSAAQLQTDRVFAAIFVLSAMGVALFAVVALVERLALGYRQTGLGTG
jgi:ABC-type nitrate/sulfonate/bicarbonate transport system permease component